MLRIAFPSSLGAARAEARGELVKKALETQLHDTVRVEVASDYGSLVGLVRASAVDLLWAPSVVVSRIEDDVELVMKSVRDGRSTYRAALLARRDAGLLPQRLTGTKAAWVDRTSLAGHLLVKEHLRGLGLDPEKLFAKESFVGSYPEAARAVVEGDADVASIFVPDHKPEVVDRAIGLLIGAPRATRLSALFVTEAVPTDALVVTRTLPEPRRAQIIEALFPKTEPRPRPHAFCLAMEVDGFERAQPGEYKKLRALWID